MTTVPHNSCPVLNTYIPTLFLELTKHLKNDDLKALFNVNKNCRSYRYELNVLQEIFERYSPKEIGISSQKMLQILNKNCENLEKQVVLRNFNPCNTKKVSEGILATELLAFKSIPNLVINNLTLEGITEKNCDLLSCLFESFSHNHHFKNLTFVKCHIPATTLLLLADIFQSLEAFNLIESKIVGTNNFEIQQALCEFIEKNPLLKKLDLYDFTMGESVFDTIQDTLPHLESLKINSTSSLDESVFKEFVLRFPFLKEISLKNLSVGNDFLLKFPETWSHLKVLNLTGNTSLDVNFFTILSTHCIDLEEIVLEKCNAAGGVTDAGIKALTAGCKKLKVINLSECPEITDESLFAIANNCPNLTEIYLDNCSGITNKGIKALAFKLRSKLETLCIRNCTKVSDDAINDLANLCKHLRILDVSYNDRISDDAMISLIKATKLEKLYIHCCLKMSNNVLYHLLEHSPAIEALDCVGCMNITPEAIQFLQSKASRLKYFMFEVTSEPHTPANSQASTTRNASDSEQDDFLNAPLFIPQSNYNNTNNDDDTELDEDETTDVEPANDESSSERTTFTESENDQYDSTLSSRNSTPSSRSDFYSPENSDNDQEMEEVLQSNRGQKRKREDS